MQQPAGLSSLAGQTGLRCGPRALQRDDRRHTHIPANCQSANVPCISFTHGPNHACASARARACAHATSPLCRQAASRSWLAAAALAARGTGCRRRQLAAAAGAGPGGRPAGATQGRGGGAGEGHGGVRAGDGMKARGVMAGADRPTAMCMAWQSGQGSTIDYRAHTVGTEDPPRPPPRPAFQLPGKCLRKRAPLCSGSRWHACRSSSSSCNACARHRHGTASAPRPCLSPRTRRGYQTAWVSHASTYIQW